MANKYRPANFRVIRCSREEWRAKYRFKDPCYFGQDHCRNKECTYVHFIEEEYERKECDEYQYHNEDNNRIEKRCRNGEHCTAERCYFLHVRGDKDHWEEVEKAEEKRRWERDEKSERRKKMVRECEERKEARRRYERSIEENEEQKRSNMEKIDRQLERLNEKNEAIIDHRETRIKHKAILSSAHGRARCLEERREIIRASKEKEEALMRGKAEDEKAMHMKREVRRIEKEHGSKMWGITRKFKEINDKHERNAMGKLYSDEQAKQGGNWAKEDEERKLESIREEEKEEEGKEENKGMRNEDWKEKAKMDRIHNEWEDAKRIKIEDKVLQKNLEGARRNKELNKGESASTMLKDETPHALAQAHKLGEIQEKEDHCNARISMFKKEKAESYKILKGTEDQVSYKLNKRLVQDAKAGIGYYQGKIRELHLERGELEIEVRFKEYKKKLLGKPASKEEGAGAIEMMEIVEEGGNEGEEADEEGHAEGERQEGEPSMDKDKGKAKDKVKDGGVPRAGGRTKGRMNVTWEHQEDEAREDEDEEFREKDKGEGKEPRAKENKRIVVVVSSDEDVQEAKVNDRIVVVATSDEDAGGAEGGGGSSGGRKAEGASTSTVIRDEKGKRKISRKRKGNTKGGNTEDEQMGKGEASGTNRDRERKSNKKRKRREKAQLQILEEAIFEIADNRK